MASYKDRRYWLFIGFGIFLIVVLFVSLMFLIFSEPKMPDNGVVVDNETTRGEALNQEMIEKINKLIEKNPALSQLPLTVEYYSDDYSEYTKYVLSYELDNSERGFVVIMKDYTGEGTDVAFSKLREIGMDLTDLKITYEDLTEDTLNFRPDVI